MVRGIDPPIFTYLIDTQIFTDRLSHINTRLPLIILFCRSSHSYILFAYVSVSLLCRQ